MDKSMSASRSRRRTGLAPCLEPLEGRRLLAAHAAQITISEGASQGVPTLLVLGTRNADVINITDNGTNAAGNITVTLGNGGTYTTKTAVSEVEVITMGGNDQVSYTLTGPLVAERTVLTDLGSGTDQFMGNVNGAIDNSAGLDLEVYAGSGNDTMTINQSGQVMQGTFIPFMSGGRGKDTMTFNGTGSINGGAVINPAIDAGNGQRDHRFQLLGDDRRRVCLQHDDQGWKRDRQHHEQHPRGAGIGGQRRHGHHHPRARSRPDVDLPISTMRSRSIPPPTRPRSMPS